ncbi:unnamed protein product [Choristocarpus tenellus]
MLKKEETVRGMEKTLVVNHLGPFLLTNLLLPNLQRSSVESPVSIGTRPPASRIVNVASRLEKNGSIMAAERGVQPGPEWFAPPSVTGDGPYNLWHQYSTSKLCNMLFTFELDRRLNREWTEHNAGQGQKGSEELVGGEGFSGGGDSVAGRVMVNAMTPGVVNSDLGRWNNPFVIWATRPIMRLVMRSPAKGAETVIYTATSPELEGASGKFFYDMSEAPCSEGAQDKSLARELWKASSVASKLDETEEV